VRAAAASAERNRLRPSAADLVRLLQEVAVKPAR